MTCKSIIFVLLAGSICFSSFAQKREYTFFSELSVFRFTYTLPGYQANLTDSKEGLPLYEHQFDKKENFRNYKVRNDSVIRYGSVNYDNPYDFRYRIYEDFRNLTVGLSTRLWENKRFILTHSLGLNYSISNTDHEVLYADHFSFKKDSFQSDWDSSFQLQFHEEERRLGLLYDISGAVKIGRSFRFSFSLRNSFHLNYDSKFYVEYRHEVNRLREPEGDRVCFICRDIILYRNEKPTSNNYQVMEKKTRLQFDMLLYSKPEFILGKKKQSSFYFFYGVALKTRYGNQYRPDGYKPFYGLGFSRIINSKLSK
jgi:hypothetical protein